MRENRGNTDLVAYCGLYCGECGKFKKGKCKACADNEGAAWCKVRTCCIENRYSTCAECTRFADLGECGKLNNFMSKFFSVIFRSDRVGSLERIKEIGRQGYADEMIANGKMTYKK